MTTWLALHKIDFSIRAKFSFQLGSNYRSYITSSDSLLILRPMLQ